MIPGVAASSFHNPGTQYVTISVSTTTGRTFVVGAGEGNRWIANLQTNSKFAHTTTANLRSWTNISSGLVDTFYADPGYIRYTNGNWIINDDTSGGVPRIRNVTSWTTPAETTVSQASGTIAFKALTLWYAAASLYVSIGYTTKYAVSATITGSQTTYDASTNGGADMRVPTTDGTTLLVAGNANVSYTTSTSAPFSWTTADPGTGTSKSRSAHYGGNIGNKYWVIGAESGKISYSTNRTSWTLTTLPDTYQVDSITFANGRWWALSNGSGGANGVFVSADDNPGSVWTNTGILPNSAAKVSSSEIVSTDGILMIGRTNNDVTVFL